MQNLIRSDVYKRQVFLMLRDSLPTGFLSFLANTICRFSHIQANYLNFFCHIQINQASQKMPVLALQSRQ